MKNFKKILLTMAMTMALGTSAFAASGFEFLFQLAGGAGAAIPNKEAKDLGFGTGLSFDADISAQIGYMFQVKEGFGISVLGELGYAWDFYLYGQGGSGTLSSNTSVNPTYTYEGEDGISIAEYYHSFKLGLLPKFNIGVGRGDIAIGIGGGVKIPVAGNYRMTIYTVGTSTVKEDVQSESEIALKRKDISDLFSPSVIGYMKVTFDYYLFFTDNIGMNFGLYLGGDFAPKQKETKIGCNSFDIGLQLGFRFGPKA